MQNWIGAKLELKITPRMSLTKFLFSQRSMITVGKTFCECRPRPCERVVLLKVPVVENRSLQFFSAEKIGVKGEKIFYHDMFYSFK